MIDIVMTTYNGKKYVEQQLCSLLYQSFRDFQVLVCDDGSTDGTMDIVNRFAGFDQRIHVIDTNGGGRGVALNFLYGISKANGDYIMLCDQDDIWLDHKVAELHKTIQSVESTFGTGMPYLVYSNAIFYDDKTSKIGDATTRWHPSTLKGFLFLNGGVQGSSMIMNRQLAELLNQSEFDVCMHDHSITLMALTRGRVFYCNKNLMLYRQHGNNVTGNNDRGIMSRIWRQFFSGRYVIDEAHFRAIHSFYRANRDCLKYSQARLFESYLAYPAKGWLARCWTILRNGFNANGSVALILLKSIFNRPLGPNGKLVVRHWTGSRMDV